MTTALTKPRWEAWENICLKKAYAEKIQHKVMAIAFNRSLTSLNKKINKLGLRAHSHQPGRIRGKTNTLSLFERIHQDISKMLKILKSDAPLECYQSAKWDLQCGRWGISLLGTEEKMSKENNTQMSQYRPLQANSVAVKFNEPPDLFSPLPGYFSFSYNLFPKEASYVPLHYVEKWAHAEGFRKLDGPFQRLGISYWKDGQHFSQTQLLMHINRIRFTHNLGPVTVEE